MNKGPSPRSSERVAARVRIGVCPGEGGHDPGEGPGAEGHLAEQPLDDLLVQFLPVGVPVPLAPRLREPALNRDRLAGLGLDRAPSRNTPSGLPPVLPGPTKTRST